MQRYCFFINGPLLSANNILFCYKYILPFTRLYTIFALSNIHTKMRKSKTIKIVVYSAIIILVLTAKVFGENTVSNFPILYEYPVMNRFYRNIPLLADNYYKAPESILLEIPPFLTDESISFRYKKREAYQYEQVFADNVNIVRFLGGWSAIKNNTTVEIISQLDLAYRNEKGDIKYRWELIPARIDPILQMGYTAPNIVLDNTPWCFPEIPEEPSGGEGYGQCNPPRSMDEWGKFIADLCTELVRRYGFGRVNSWGVRLGTEAGGPTRFNGTDDEYRAFYKATALAVKSVLPNANIFPYNRSGTGHENLKTLLTEARTQNFPYTSSPISTYSIAQLDLSGELKTDNLDPDITANGPATKMWYDMDVIADPASLSHEVHEYGWFLINELGDRDSAPGARGAAGNFHYIMNLRHKRLDKLFHWSVIDPNGEWQKVILNAQGFIFSVWDYCIGARTVELNKTLKFTPQSTQKYKSVGYFNDAGKSYIMVSGYNMDRRQQNRNWISVYIPKSEFYDQNVELSYTTLNDSTDHYRMLRDDLAAKSVLYERYANDADYVPQYNTMSAKGKWWLQTDNNKYITRIKENLTLKPFKGTVQITNEGTIISFEIRTPELFVLALKKNSLSDTKSIDERKNTISFYPNPVKEKFFINGTNLEYAEIIRPDGVCIMRKNLKDISNEINIELLSAGVYFLRLQHNGTISTEQLIKQ